MSDTLSSTSDSFDSDAMPGPGELRIAASSQSTVVSTEAIWNFAVGFPETTVTRHVGSDCESLTGNWANSDRGFATSKPSTIA